MPSRTYGSNFVSIMSTIYMIATLSTTSHPLAVVSVREFENHRSCEAPLSAVQAISFAANATTFPRGYSAQSFDSKRWLMQYTCARCPSRT